MRRSAWRSATASTPTLANGARHHRRSHRQFDYDERPGRHGRRRASSQHNWSDATIGHGEAVFVHLRQRAAPAAAASATERQWRHHQYGRPSHQRRAGPDVGSDHRRVLLVACRLGRRRRGRRRIRRGDRAATAATSRCCSARSPTAPAVSGPLTPGLLHNGNANILLDDPRRQRPRPMPAAPACSLNSQIVSGPNVDGNGDDVTATVGARTQVHGRRRHRAALAATGNATFDQYLNAAPADDARRRRPYQIQSGRVGRTRRRRDDRLRLGRHSAPNRSRSQRRRQPGALRAPQ